MRQGIPGMLVLFVTISGFVAEKGAVCAADSSPRPETPALPSPSTEEIAAWIRRLDSPDFETRESATKALIAGGPSVIDSVAAAADTHNLELATRSIAVLGALFASGDIDTRMSARQALTRLAESKTPSVARRAALAIAPPSTEDMLGIPRVRGFRMRAVQAGNLQAQIGNNDGRVEMRVFDQGRRIHIAHRGGNDITIRVDEPAAEGGKPAKVVTYAAGNVAELKVRHPAGWELLDKYNGLLGLGLVTGGGGDRAVDAERFKTRVRELDAARKELELRSRALDDASKKPGVPPEELKKASDALTAAVKRLVEIQSRPLK
jgi:hypothetical protein